MPFFDHPRGFRIYGCTFNNAGRDINKHTTKNYNHTVTSNNTNSNNIIGSNNTVNSNNWSPPDPSYSIPRYKQHFTGQWDGIRREHGYHPYSRPDQGHSYSYVRSGGGGRPRSYRTKDASPVDLESGLPPTEEPAPRRKSQAGRAQQPFYEPASGYPFPNVPGLSSHSSRGGDAGSAQYAAQPQARSPNLQSSERNQSVPSRPNPPPSPDEGAGTNNPFCGLNSQREYPPSPPWARYAPTPRTSANRGRGTTPDDAARRNTRDCDSE